MAEKDPPKPSAATKLSTDVQVATGLITAQAYGAPKPCPRPDWSKLPQFGRDITALMFLPTCLPGTETLAGCPASSAAYVIAIPFDRFIAEGRVAPGGNRYWSTSLPLNLKDPKVTSLLKIMARRSKDKFLSTFGGSAAKTIRDVTKTGEWSTAYGVIHIENPPTSLDQTVGDFIKRGGYLLHVPTIRDGGLLQAYGSQPWMGSSIRQSELWGNYDAPGNQVNYTIRLVLNNSWTTVVNDVNGWATKNLGKLCGQLADSDAQMAASIMTAYPATMPFAAGYKAALTICNIPFSPPPCVPQPPLPGAANPVMPSIGVAPVLQSIKSQTIWGTGIQAGNMMTTTTVAPAQGPLEPGALPPPNTSPYPDGTIAWLDTSVPGYRVAIPMPGDGTTHQPISAGALTTLPAVGIRLVTKSEWEQATLPWIRRSTTKIGMMAAGIAVALAGTAYASR